MKSTGAAGADPDDPGKTAEEAALKRAEKIINAEHGFALSVAPEEVPAFMAARLRKTG